MIAARLRRGEDIARCRAEGVARNDQLFSLRARPSGGDMVRVAVSASRAVGPAVRRNRARRRLREAIRLELSERSLRPGAGLDLVVAARAAATTASAQAVRGAIARGIAAALQIAEVAQAAPAAPMETASR